MKVLLADDEPLARDRLRRLLAEIDDVELAGEASHGEELLALVKKAEPDVVLLDIHMPGLDGLQTAQQLKSLPLPPAVIFITAYSEHALSAFDTAASGYLLKPVRQEQLAQALVQCQRSHRAQLQPAQEEGSPIHLMLRRGQRQLRIPADSIICCLADQKLTRIVHEQGEDLSELSLQELETLLGNAFIRVHRSALVAKAQIRGLEGQGIRLRLKLADYDEPIAVSRRRAAPLRAELRGE